MLILMVIIVTTAIMIRIIIVIRMRKVIIVTDQNPVAMTKPGEGGLGAIRFLRLLVLTVAVTAHP